MSLTKEFFLLGILVLVGASFSLCMGWAQAPWMKPALQSGEIRAIDARGLDILWIDARSAKAFAEAHIKDAIWLNPNDPDAALMLIAENWLKNPKPIVLYCTSEACTSSKELANWLRNQLPDAEIYSLKGGWSAWLQLN
jgi:rhodanese-related sulfurtransferase